MKRLPVPKNPSLPTTKGASELDVEIARIQSEASVRLARLSVENTRVQADADTYAKSMELYAQETIALVQGTQAMAMKALETYVQSGAPDFSVKAKTKLFPPLIWGRSCTVTVSGRSWGNSEPQYREPYYLRRPKR